MHCTQHTQQDNTPPRPGTGQQSLSLTGTCQCSPPKTITADHLTASGAPIRCNQCSNTFTFHT